MARLCRINNSTSHLIDQRATMTVDEVMRPAEMRFTACLSHRPCSQAEAALRHWVSIRT